MLRTISRDSTSATARSTSSRVVPPFTTIFPLPKQQHHWWVVETVDQPQKLLGFVLDVPEAHSDSDRVQVQPPAEVRPYHYVLNGGLWVVSDRSAKLPDVVEHASENRVDVLCAARIRRNDHVLNFSFSGIFRRSRCSLIADYTLGYYEDNTSVDGSCAGEPREHDEPNPLKNTPSLQVKHHTTPASEE